MPEYLQPGVYIEEIERGPRPIEGVPTSTAAILGETERGPVHPRLVTSYAEYRRWFGGPFGADKYMPDAVNGFFENGGKRAYICRIVKKAAATASATLNDLRVTAVGPGSSGNRIFLHLRAGSVPARFRVQVAYWTDVSSGFAPVNPIDHPDSLPRPAVVEDFNDLSADVASPDHFGKRVNGNSSLITLDLTTVADGDPKIQPTDNGTMLTDGADADGDILTNDLEGDDLEADRRTGLSALLLDEFRDVALVYAPGITDKDRLSAIISHCENQKFRFAVIDSDSGVSDASSLDPRTQIAETQYAAFYYPWIEIADPETGARKKIPPGGHVLGIYVRTDVERGVFKAPANEIVRGALKLEYSIDDSTQALLNPRGVNAIRTFPGRGIRVWGARTLSTDPLWKYVNVRRLFIFLERSIYEGTQWVVFEPNDERLWERVKDTIRLFLRSQWRAGAMFGRTENEAFFVTCDRTTMTEDDILNGRLVCEIGIAPVRPAEFVIFRIFQHTAEAKR